MTASSPSALRAVFFDPESPDTRALPAYRLLKNLGHDVVATNSFHEVAQALEDDPDLVLVDFHDNDEDRKVLDRLANLPDTQRPQAVAVFTQGAHPVLNEFRARMAADVYVLRRPLHVHGLLRILRGMEPRETQLSA